MDHKKLVNRYESILMSRRSGDTYRLISERLGISRERVRQIIVAGFPKEIFCRFCGKDVGGNYKICKECFPKNIQGRGRTRMMVRIRDRFTCQECGLVRTPEMAKEQGSRLLDVHHLNGLCGKMSRGYDRSSDISKLITLCHRCHFNRHDWSGNLKK
jgi:hypothetical protein